MAKFVSPHRNFRVGIREGLPQRLGPYGEQLPEQKELTAEFTPDLRDDEALEFALSVFNFRGLPIYESGQKIDGSYRVSAYDTELAQRQQGWTDEERLLVEEALRNTNSAMCQELVPAPAEKPWNGYDTLTDPARIVELAVGINADLATVIKYEEQNENREAVIEALQLAQEGGAETIVVSA